MSDTVVRIFVSSPADVDHERAVVKDIVEQLATEYLPYFELRTVLWEEEALTADRTFQAGLTQPQDCDIVLVILWTRLGSPLPQQPYRGMTGTEWEFVNAVEASARTGTPEVLVYKKTTPKLVDITDAGLAREAIDDRRRLEDFFRTHFFFEDNSFRRAFRTFDNATAFRELVATQLRKLLNRRISAERRAAIGDLRWQGSPFRPDRPFDTSDERIFTGREQEVRELLRAFEGLAAGKSGLLLVTGASGSGKTSLLRAGVLPRLTRPFQLDGIAAVHVCLVETADGSADPITALAEALCAQATIGGLLARFGLGAPALSRLLGSAPELAAHQIGSAIAQHASGSGGDHRLLLLLDPLDRLLEQADDEPLRRLAQALHALALAPAVWVVALLRSDAVPALARLPALHALIRTHGWSEIEPLSAARIRQVVEIPARVAGIELDTNRLGERGLVEHLEAEAGRLRLWPPLLQPVLEAAYRHALQRQADRGGGGSELWLSGADYQAAGGLGQQVLTRATAVWSTVDAETRAALPRLCRALITLEGGAIGQPTLRYGNLQRLRRDPSCKRLLEALIEARLIISEGLHDPTLSIHCKAPDARIGSELTRIWHRTRRDWRRRWQRPQAVGADPEPLAGEARAPSTPAARTTAALPATAVAAGSAPTVDAGAGANANANAGANTDTAHQDWREYQAVASFSHPWLLTHWEPVRAWLAVPGNRRLLARRFQLDRQAQLWKRTNCNSEYLLRDAGSAEALALQETYADELEPLEREFIEQSKAHLALLGRRRLLVRLVGLVLAILLLISALSAGLAYLAYTDAQINLSRSKLNEAKLSINRGNTRQAVALALDAGAELPQRAVQTLGLAFSSNRLLALAAASPVADEPRVPGFNAEGSHLATFLPGRGATLLKLEQGRFEPIQALAEPALGVHTLVFGPGTLVVGIGAEGIWRLPASADAEPDYACGAPPGLSLALDESRRRLALGRPGSEGQQDICVVDLSQPGRIVFEQALADGPLRSLSFAPDGEALLTAAANGRARLIDLKAGAPILSLPSDKASGRPFNRAVFDASGERIAIASADDRIRLYRRDGEPIAELSSARIGGRDFSMHRSAVRDVAFDPSGNFLVAVDDEGQIVRWNLSEDARGAKDNPPQRFDQAVVLASHRLSAGTVRIIEPPARTEVNESLVLSASLDGTAKLTGLQTGKPIAVLGHDAAIGAAGFHAEGERVATFSARDGTVRLWSVKPVSRLAYRRRHPDHVWYVDTATAPPAIARGEDALLLATAGFDGGVRVWRYSRKDGGSGPTAWAEFLDDDSQRPVRQVRFSPSGRRLVSAHNDGSARVADLINKRIDCRLQVTESERGEVYNALFSPDGDWILTTSNDPATPVRVFSSQTCEPVDTADGSQAGLRHGGRAIQAAALASTAAGTLVATGDEAGTLRLSERTQAGRWHQRCRIETGVGAIGDIALSPDARRIAVAGEANRAALIRLEAPTASGPADASRTAEDHDPQADDCGPLRYLEGHGERLYSIAFAPDGKQLVTASLDKTARLWDRHGDPIAILAGHQDRIYRAEFSPDGRWLLTGSRDGSLRIWKRPSKASDGVQRLSTFLPLEADAGGVANAVFSPDGHYVAGAYWENAMILWRLWAEDDPAAASERADWGPDRSALALVREAYRFRRDNRVSEPAGRQAEAAEAHD
ncbi:MAG: AAA family ATPase, partial [Halochromatium sp.]|uniref:NACHT and WD repeat domain-containing protein n=1 Tax=Halochromatium sp. TaxID=2049430 RepID=UPI003978ED65